MFFSIILTLLFWAALIIGGVIAIISFLRRRKRLHPSADSAWYLRFALSREDAASQGFLLLAVVFLGVTLVSFNRNFDDPFSWRVIVFVTSAAALAVAYYYKAVFPLLAGIIGAAFWWLGQAVEWAGGGAENVSPAAVFSGMLLIAVLYYAIGRAHEINPKFKRFALVWSGLGLIAATAALFSLSTNEGLRMFAEFTRGGTVFGSWEIVSSLAVFVAAIAAALVWTAAKKLVSVPELLAVCAAAVLFGSFALLPAQEIFTASRGAYYYPRELSSIGILWALVFNIALFAELVGFLFLGYIRRERWLVNMGTILMLVFIFIKYFDWFFEFLDKSVFFIVAGVLLLALGWFMERGRKYVIARMQPEEPRPGGNIL